LKVVFAGAGTGGHLMTGLSLAQEIKANYPDADITFFLTSKRLDEHCVLEKGFAFRKLKYSVGSSGSIFHKFRFLIGLVLDFVYSCFVLRKIKPELVVGLGGYSSAPPVMAATIMFVPFVLIDQNVVPGKVNRIFSRWAKEVYCHFSQSSKWLSHAKTLVVTGNPIRKEIFNARKEDASQTFGLSLMKKTVLILGGSQGARAINETMINCLHDFEKDADRLQIIHCTGEKDFDEVNEIYKQYKIDAYVSRFMSRIELAYSMADIVISRAGAGTISEINAVGLPAILIPYPYAADNHQYYNALEIEQHGGAYLIKQEDFTVDTAIKLITELLADDERRGRMATNSRKLGKPNAVKSIIKRIEELIESKKEFCSSFQKSSNVFPYYCK